MKAFITTLLAAGVLTAGAFALAPKADAQIQADTVTQTVNLPMLSVAMSGMDLTIGSNSPSVAVLERYLQQYGYFPQTVAPDTVFDATTLQALRAYQAQAHVLSTGYFGPQTRAHMWVVLWFRVNGYATPFN